MFFSRFFKGFAKPKGLAYINLKYNAGNLIL